MHSPVRNAADIPVQAVAAFCQRWNIVELALFGSILREDFSPQSDIDVLVRFQDGVQVSLADFVQLADELEAMFGRKVDLLTRSSVEQSRNYLRRKEILNTAEVIYAA
jgi:predicted nucleotidyltransferase